MDRSLTWPSSWLTIANQMRQFSIQFMNQNCMWSWKRPPICAKVASILTTTLSVGYSLKRPVGYSFWVYLRILRIIIYFEVPRIGIAIEHHASWNRRHLWYFWVTEGDDVPNQDLVLVTRIHNGNNGNTTMFIFRHHVGFKLFRDCFYTILSRTNYTFDFGLA